MLLPLEIGHSSRRYPLKDPYVRVIPHTAHPVRSHNYHGFHHVSGRSIIIRQQFLSKGLLLVSLYRASRGDTCTSQLIFTFQGSLESVDEDARLTSAYVLYDSWSVSEPYSWWQICYLQLWWDLYDECALCLSGGIHIL